MMDNQKVRALLSKDLDAENYDVSEQGLFFPKHGIQVSGEYIDRINGGEWNRTKNLITKEGMIHVLNVALGSKAKASGYYLALFSGATAPADNWTAANFSAVSNEIVSLTEGYTNPTRPQFVAADTTDQKYIDNFASTARVTIATTSQLNVTGTALLTSSVRGGTTGVLLSATKYAAARTFQDGDTYDIGYRFSVTS